MNTFRFLATSLVLATTAFAQASPSLAELQAEYRRLAIDINVMVNQLADLRREYERVYDAMISASLTRGAQAQEQALRTQVETLREQIRQLEARLEQARIRRAQVGRLIGQLRNPAPQPPVQPPAPRQPVPPAGGGAQQPPAPKLPPAPPVVTPRPPRAPTTPPCGCREGQSRTFNIQLGKVWYPLGKKPGEAFLGLAARVSKVFSSLNGLQAWTMNLAVTQQCRGGKWVTTGLRVWFKEIPGEIRRERLGFAEKLIVDSWQEAAEKLRSERRRLLAR